MSVEVKIKKVFPGFTLDVEFAHENGRIGILGASGSGKSMTLKCIAGIEKPDEGRIVVNGKVLYDSEMKVNLPPQQRKVGYLFQNYALFPNMTVEGNIGVGIKDKNERKSAVENQIRRFRLEGLEGRYPAQLSGGQQQRVALARLMASEPDIILLDEAFSALDTYLKETLQLEMMEILDQYDRDVLMVSHSRDEIYKFCPDCMVVDQGMVRSRGNTKEVFERPRYVGVARLTGCKNVVEARKLDGEHVFIPGWNVNLKAAVPVPDSVTHVGIRAHCFKPVSGEGDGNCIPVHAAGMTEDIFEMNFIFKSEKSCQESGENIWWKVDKGTWINTMGRLVPNKVFVSPEDVMILKE